MEPPGWGAREISPCAPRPTSCVMDLLDAAKHYPGLKKQWLEFLGECPTAETDRVETSDTAAA